MPSNNHAIEIIERWSRHSTIFRLHGGVPSAPAARAAGLISGLFTAATGRIHLSGPTSVTPWKLDRKGRDAPISSRPVRIYGVATGFRTQTK